MISFRCSECKKEYEVADDFAGKRFECKNCGNVVVVSIGIDNLNGGTMQDKNSISEPVPPEVVNTRISVMAIVSLVLGILGFCTVGLTAIIGLILGVIALISMGKQPRQLRGRGLAIAGVVVSSVSFFVIILWITILVPAFGRANELAHRIHCASQLKGIGNAITLYQNDYSDKNPPDFKTLVDICDVHPNSFLCISSSDQPGDISYIYRGADLDATASSDMVLIYEPLSNHQDECSNVLFADGHVKRVEAEDFPTVIEKDNKIRRSMGLPEKPIEDGTLESLNEP